MTSFAFPLLASYTFNTNILPTSKYIYTYMHKGWVGPNLTRGRFWSRPKPSVQLLFRGPED